MQHTSSSFLKEALLRQASHGLKGLLKRLYSQKAPLKAATIIWLHGLGDQGQSWEDLRREFHSHPEFRYLKWRLPDAPMQAVTANGGYVMPAWFDLESVPVKQNGSSRTDVDAAVKYIHGLLDQELAAGTRADRLLLGGFSQGGAVALASSLLYKQPIGGAIAWSGWLPLQDISGRHVSTRKQTPVLWCHGAMDDRVSPDLAEKGVAKLRDMGVHCDSKVYDDLGHDVCSDEIEDLKSWVQARLLEPMATTH